MSGVPFLVAEIGQMLGRNLQDVRAVLGERAGASRPGKHPREIKHADARKRPIPSRQWLGRAVADSHDFHQWQAAMDAD